MLNYQKIGLKVGLEIHFQLDTKHKLFCNCNTNLIDERPDFTIKRYLHPVLSEIGEKDVVAEFEKSKNRYAIYEAYNDKICLVELDDEPIHKLNEEALEIALQISMMLNARIVDGIQVMRKQVLDYSNTSGFQRTALISLNGNINTKKGEVGISSIFLEEEAARKINENKEYVTYRLDRLGIPLIEIATAADIKDPEQAQEVATYLGQVLKSTGKTKHILGSIRQDINVSITGGARTEIKGVQRLSSIPPLIKNEVIRQLNMIKEGKNVQNEVRLANEDYSTNFLRPMPNSSRMYIETDIPTIKVTKKQLSNIKVFELLTEKAIKLEKEFGISAELALEIVEDENYFRLLTERFKNLKPSIIIHSITELPKEAKTRFNYIASNQEIEEILEYLNSEKISKDSIIAILEDKASGKKINIDDYKPMDVGSVKKEIHNLVKANKHLSPNAIMGMVMSKYKGKIDGKKAMEYIKKFL